MGISKAEGALYALGGLAVAGAFAFRKRIEPKIVANAVIFGGGTLLTAGAMTIYRRRSGQTLLGDGLGLSHVQTVQKGEKKTKVYVDANMGIQERVHLLQGLVAESVKDPDVRRLALAVTGYGDRKFHVGDELVEVSGANCKARDDVCELKAIFDWTADPRNIRYTGDIGAHAISPGGPVEPIDLFATARRAIENRGEDCDGHSIVNASLGVLNGFPAKFRITSNTGDTWDHIYTMLGVPKLAPTRWFAIDSTLGQGKFNKQPRRAKEVDFAA